MAVSTSNEDAETVQMRHNINTGIAITFVALVGLSSGTQAAQPSASQSLFDQAEHCQLTGYAGEDLFAHSAPATDLTNTSVDICDIGATVLESQRLAGLRQIGAQFCTTAMDLANEYGDGSMQRAIEVIGRKPTDAQSAAELHALKVCSNKTARDEALNSILGSMETKIVSVGEYTVNGESCVGALGLFKSGNVSYGHQLIGVGACEHIKMSSSLFHPMDNPDGQYVGDYYATELGYTGYMPAVSNYRGSDYPLYTGVQRKNISSSTSIIFAGSTPAPSIAAALPVNDSVASHANRLADIIDVGLPSYCAQQSNRMREIGGMDAPSSTRKVRVDAIFDVVWTACF